MIFLAIRYLLERRRQTLFTLLGVFLGTMAYVSVSGFFAGFQGYLVQQLINNTAQIHIQARQDFVAGSQLDGAFFGPGLEQGPGHVFWREAPARIVGNLGVQNPQSWYERLRADPRVQAFSPQLAAPALFNISDVSVSANLIGCDPIQQARVTSVAEYVDQGSFEAIASGGNRVILGAELMKRLGAAMDQTVLVSVGTQPPVPFKVVGRYFTGNRMADMTAYGALSDVQRINRTPNRVNEIAVRLRDYTQAADMATTWSMIAPERTESWDQQFGNILSMFKIQNALRYSMIATILIVAGFGIYNVLNMTVSQKKQDIAILRSMGYDTFDVIMLFFSQGLLLGGVGGFLGLVVGYVFCLYLQTIPFGGVGMSSAGSHLHISLNPWIYAQGACISILAAAAASILPSRAAGKLTPIEIIRSGG